MEARVKLIKMNNIYLIKALDSYPYNLEEAIESLNYALSYDDKNSQALCLMGRFQTDIFKDYETAKEYFQDALAEDVHAFYVYPYYISVLIDNEDYTEAENLINYALTVKGVDRGVIYGKKVYLLECLQKYKKALETIKIAKTHTYNDNFIDFLNEFKERIKKKMPKEKKTGKKKKK